MLEASTHIDDLVGKEFACKANDAIEICFVSSSSELHSVKGVHPEFTHQIFGDSELIVGYKDLEVKLCYAAGTMMPYVSMKFSEKLEPKPTKLPAKRKKSLEKVDPDAIGAQDVIGTLKEYIPTFLTKDEEFIEYLTKENSFHPESLGGKCVHSYLSKKQTKCSIFKFCLENAAFRAFHARLQTFLLFYIDGASFIDAADAKWEIYVAFEHQNGIYRTLGYATMYPFYSYPDHTRMRVSQFLIFPVYQKLGHGQQLYECLYNEALRAHTVQSFVVEDPNDAFQTLRDYCDLSRWIRDNSINKVLDVKDVSTALLNDKISLKKLEKATKLSRKQILRLVEIILFKICGDQKEYQQRVKRRLYKACEEDIGALPEKEAQRSELNRMYNEQLDSYRQILQSLITA